MNVKETLLKLCSFEGISGRESEISKFLEIELKNYSNNIKVSALGNIICEISKKQPNRPKIMLDAHMDCIGMVVREITDEGLLKIVNCGGLDPKLLVSQEVKIFGKKILDGIIQGNKSIKTIEDLQIDVGMNKPNVEKLVNIGDQISFKYCPIVFNENEISTRFLDNRAGVIIILLTLEKLKNMSLNCGLDVVFSSLEEVSGGGAKTASHFLNPDIAVCIDVSFAEFLGCEKNKLGKLGKGPLIGISPILQKDLTLKLKDIAEKNKIPHQFEIMSSLTSTNADAINSSKNGIATCLCSVPLKYMHSPVEVIDLNDLEYTSNLLAKFICSF